MEGGLQLATAYEYLFKKHNLLIPGGSCWAVCAGGHVTGGGYGIYSVDHGTTCDYLAGVHFACVCAPPPHPTDPDAHSSARAVHTGVDSTGKVRETHAWANSPEYELRQLLWACRGAMVRIRPSPSQRSPPPPPVSAAPKPAPPSLPQAGNFGVILKYYFDLPKLAQLCKAPRTYYNLWITPAAIGTKYCTCTMCAI